MNGIIEKNITFEKITDKNILNRVLDFKNKAVSYFEGCFLYINIDYIKSNNLILYPTYKLYKGEYEFGCLEKLFKKNELNYVYILLLNKEKKVTAQNYIKELKEQNSETLKYFENNEDEYFNLIEINFSSDIEVFKVKTDKIILFYQKYFAYDTIIFPSLSFDFFILSTYFYYDLICGKKEIVDNFVKMTNKQAIKKLKEIDEDIEDPIRLYNIYGEYFEEKIKNGEK